MLVVGQKVKLKNRAMLSEYFDNEGTVIQLHYKNEKICWVEFETGGLSETLNVHETELEVFV